MLIAAVLALGGARAAIASEPKDPASTEDGIALASPVHTEAAPGVAAEEQRWQLQGQVTYIYQLKPSFSAAYTLPGFNSLSPDKEASHSLTATAYLGIRPWAGGELYYDEEMVLGVPLTGLLGLASVPNSELQKASGPNPTFYRPRFFLRQTWDFGGGSEHLESGLNQLASTVDKRRLVLTAGNFAVVDVFDNNAYAHDGRRDFFNWVNVAHGAYDYAADVRGYTWGAALEWYAEPWVLRAGRFIVPRQSNGLQLNYSIMNFHGDQIELEHAHELAGEPGKVRLLAFRNRELMGGFQDALDYAAAHGGGAPDVGNVRRPNVKHGYGVNLEQSVARDLGLFARASWNDGQTEMFSYTEVERSFQVGASLNGARWGREQDTLGIAFVQNGLSDAHQRYLAAGGTGFLIGDGRLNYRPERLLESYYSLAVAKSACVSLDYQHVTSPAYNADRGPVNIWGVRLHSEF